MIEIRIGSSTRNLTSLDENWINEQINRRRAEKQTVCVEVVFRTDDLDMGLSTPACQRAGTGSRPPNDYEQAILDLWEKNHLNTSEFTGGNLTAFIKQLKKLTLPKDLFYQNY